MNKIMCVPWVLVLLLLSQVSCSKENSAPVPELVISTEQILLSNTGEIKAFHVKSNMEWSASSSAGWLTLSPSNGGSGTSKVEVTASVNYQIDDRTAELTITAAGLTKRIDVIQSASALFSVSADSHRLSNEGQELTLTVESNKPYTVEIDFGWLSRKHEPSVDGTSYAETFVIAQNDLLFARKATISFIQGDERIVVSVEQAAAPLHISPVSAGVSSDAPTLAAKLRVGWNLGNALEAASSPEVADETLWGNPRTTKALIDAVKAAGFNAVRIPCAWSGYIEDRTTHRLRESWLARVKEVVDYCVDNDMYAIINIHWDGGWLEEHPLYSHQAEVNAKQKALWEQIGVYFRDYDERLLFAGTNEVRANYLEPTAEHNEVQQSYNQTFVDAVRSTGGRNAYRNLIVQAYNTNIQWAVKYLKMPTDQTSNRLMAEVHYYDPWDFAGDESSDKYLWGSGFSGSPNVSNWGQEAWVDEQFGLMKSNFVDKGIPVILGEYGAILRSGLSDATALQNHKKARNAYLAYVTKTARANGLISFYWDNGVTGNNGFGLFNRNNNTVAHPDAVEAIMSGL